MATTLEDVLEGLLAAPLLTCEQIGGYPPQMEIVAEHLVCANQDHDGGPELIVLDAATAIARWDRAVAGLASGEFEDMEEALIECELSAFL